MKRHIPYIVIAIAVAVGSFFGGVTYADSKTGGTNGTRQGAAGMPRNFVGGAGATARGDNGLVSGEVIGKDDKSVTVKLPTGGSRIAFFTPSTPVMTATSGTIEDVVTGKEVMIVGTPTSDGSVTASMIQIGFPQNFGARRPTGTDASGATQQPSKQ